MDFFNRELKLMKLIILQEELTCGRGDANDIILSDQRVSRLHAIIRKEEGTDIIRIYGENGVNINGKLRKKKQVLSFGDRIIMPGCLVIYLGRILAVEGISQGSFSMLDRKKLPFPDKKEAESGLYYRSPRRRLKVDLQDMVLEAPPEVTAYEERALPMLLGQSLMMTFPMLLGSLFMVWAYGKEARETSLSMYVGVVSVGLTMVFSLVWALILRQDDRRRYKKKENSQTRLYERYLKKRENLLQEKYDAFRNTLYDRYPAAMECIALIHGGLWSRHPAHEDYVSYRIGIGDEVLPFSVRLPPEPVSVHNTKLWEKARTMIRHYEIVRQVPIRIDFRKYGQVGVIGERQEEVCAFLRSLLVQIGACNSYTETKVFFLCGKDEAKEWDFLRFMPHIWNEGKTRRYFGAGKKEARDICETLMRWLENRDESQVHNQPAVFVFVTDPSVVEEEPVYDVLSRPERIPGLYVIWGAKKEDHLPYACSCILERSTGFQGSYEITGLTGNEKRILFDEAGFQATDRFMRAVSGICLREMTKKELPETLSIFEMYGMKKTEDIHPLERWKENDICESIQAQIGIREGGGACILDLHERHHGPHGLIAGMTGSGKSEVIQTMILSIALNYSPEAVNFFLIDYKGGGMAALLEGLPHICAEISNLSGNMIRRAMISVKSENRRRQRLFRKYGTQNINEYIRLYQAGLVKEPLPHLIILIDEFAEMKREEPEFMQELISVAQVGRSLGLHLILSTQKPAGTVDENIWSNSRFRICLRVQNRQDSMDMLHSPDASSIRHVGRGYLQVGNDEKYERFQSGWSTAPYEDSEENKRAAWLVRRNGQRESMPFQKKGVAEEMTQLRLLTDLLKNSARKAGIKHGRSLWSKPLSSRVYLEHARIRSSLEMCLGLFDDPEEQSQYSFYVNLESCGHVMICGITMSGKSVLIQTMLYSLFLKTSAGELHVRVFDYGGGSLHVFKSYPQVGDYIGPEETERGQKLIRNLFREYKARRNALKGISFLSARQSGKRREPYILIVIDGFSSFYTEYEDSLEKELYELFRFGSNAGILFLISSTGPEPSEIPSGFLGHIQTKIALTMKDRYQYGELMGLLHVPVFPETGMPGRGIARKGEKILEFQTALCLEADNDLARQEKILEMGGKLSSRYHGPCPDHTLVLPKKIPWKNFMKDSNNKELCLGYSVETGEILQIDSFFCLYLSGKQNRICVFLAKMLQRNPGARIYVLDMEQHLSSMRSIKNIEYVEGKPETLFSFFDAMTPELEDRVRHRKKHYDKDFYIFIGEMSIFLDYVYNSKFNMSGFVENMFEKGEEYGLHFIAWADEENEFLMDSYPAYHTYCSYKTGIHMGHLSGAHPFVGNELPVQSVPEDPTRGYYLCGNGVPVEMKIPEVTTDDLC